MAKHCDKLDIVGKKFGKITVIKYHGKDSANLQHTYVCKCDCGSKFIVRRCNLIHGQTRTCGCSRKKLYKGSTSTLDKSRTYRLWSQLKHKCTNENHYMYEVYEGMFPKEWNTYQGFLDDMGEVPEGCSIYRLDTTKPFSKENCEYKKLVRGKIQ